MTRINVVPVTELCDQHLLAEYRELPRVFGLVHKAQDQCYMPCELDLPDTYLLGTGHVKFFYDKLLWLSWRHIALVNEIERRGFTANFTQNLRVVHEDLYDHWWNDYTPTPEALALNRARIAERLSTMEPRYTNVHS